MALTEVRSLLELLGGGVTPYSIAASSMREPVRMLLRKYVPDEAQRLLVLLVGSALVDSTALKRDVPMCCTHVKHHPHSGADIRAIFERALTKYAYIHYVRVHMSSP